MKLFENRNQAINFSQKSTFWFVIIAIIFLALYFLYYMSLLVERGRMIIGGIATFFAPISVYTGKVVVDECSDTYLAAAGLIPVAGEATLSTCAGMTGLWAISTFMMGAAAVGCWTYDSVSTNSYTANANISI